jgi:formate dehydrogenase major subunit
MGARVWLQSWPVYRQLTGGDPWGRGAAVKSGESAHLHPRIADADAVVKSVCPYCAVGSGRTST